MSFRFKLGADPEFNIVTQNRRLHAAQTIERFMCKGGSSTLVVDGVGEVGHDGADATGEFRVVPSNDPKVLAERFKTLIGNLATSLPFADISPLSTFASVGGHIHFETEANMRSDTAKFQNIVRKIASFYLPLSLGENKLNTQIRLRGGAYGKLSDVRCETHGGARTIEYRAPSAEWLITPKICEATFAYLGTIYHEILKGNTKAMELARPMLMKNQVQMEALQTLAASDFTYLVRALHEDMKKAIRGFELYPEFKDQIEYILTPERVLADKEKVGYELTRGWGFTGATRFTKKDLVSDKVFAEKSKDMDLDRIGQLVNISYNTDANVEAFARKLSERVSAFRWKLNHTYFLFGMRKGIDKIVVRNGKKVFLQGDEQVKTKKDEKALHELFDRMQERFFGKVGRPGKLLLDFMSTGKNAGNESTIVIGLPYELRREGNIRPLLEAIYRAERGRQRKVERKALIDDSALPAESSGTIFQVMNKKEEDLPFDSGSNQAVRQQEMAIAAMTAELDRETTS